MWRWARRIAACLSWDQRIILEGFGIREGMDADGIRERMREHLHEAGKYGGSTVEVGRRRVRVDGRALSPTEPMNALNLEV